jgi:uncharacterized membrane protein YfcA
MNFMVFAFIGVLTGICAGVFGIGGGIVIVPTLIYFFGYEQYAANATSLVALLLPVGFLGVLEYYRSGKISPDQIKVGLMIAVGIFFGTLIGAKIAINLPQATLKKIFSVFLAFVALKMWFQF